MTHSDVGVRESELAFKPRPGKHLRGNVLPRVLPAIALTVAHLLAKASEERVAGRFQKPLLVRGFSRKASRGKRQSWWGFAKQRFLPQPESYPAGLALS
ncbi:hypothetical protein E2320_019593 [Naja naja]|nr:hypothetical protein E2320_019593 [Naja naja]